MNELGLRNMLTLSTLHNINKTVKRGARNPTTETIKKAKRETNN